LSPRIDALPPPSFPRVGSAAAHVASLCHSHRITPSFPRFGCRHRPPLRRCSGRRQPPARPPSTMAAALPPASTRVNATTAARLSRGLPVPWPLRCHLLPHAAPPPASLAWDASCRATHLTIYSSGGTIGLHFL